MEPASQTPPPIVTRLARGLVTPIDYVVSYGRQLNTWPWLPDDNCRHTLPDMAKGNDGHGQQLWPPPREAWQDQKYFPLGTSKAKPAIEPHWRTDNQKLLKGLAKMLGSEEAAIEYLKRRPFMKVHYGWKH
jgi:hypothetical protein